jgi:hypothetical protein
MVTAGAPFATARSSEVLKYAVVAAAAKAFSLNESTRWAYRMLGNIVLDRIRIADGLPQRYLDRAARLVGLCDRHEVLRPGDRVLELGTGWVHWEATVLRLFYDVEVTLYDICDNRLFKTYRSWLEQFRRHLQQDFDLAPGRRGRAVELLERATRADSFEELYELFDFTYVLDPTGSLQGLARDSYALVVSSDVLEHVEANALPRYLAEARRCLVPGGYSIHQIDLEDHFSYFDPTCSPKNYYRYSDRAWRRWFESQVQYFNRLQRPDWLALLTSAGFELVEEERVSQPLAEISIADEYAHLSQLDLECMQLLTVHRRPVAEASGVEEPTDSRYR